MRRRIAEVPMFERFTENARRALFFARYEAMQIGGVTIETEHLLLGVARQPNGVTKRLLAEASLTLEALRRQMASRTPLREKLTSFVEIPFSAETKVALQFAAEEADRLQHRDIGTVHLLLGILREEAGMAASILAANGIRLDAVRAAAAAAPIGEEARGQDDPSA
jgi:ATP-dependent Clp protease ATP-binding subunit ClpC